MTGKFNLYRIEPGYLYHRINMTDLETLRPDLSVCYYLDVQEKQDSIET
jgi:hypothetical protein